jgi:ubiquinone biosynthesis protein COQ9
VPQPIVRANSAADKPAFLSYLEEMVNPVPPENVLDADDALITAAFTLIAEDGWRRLSVAKAARRAGVDLAAARGRFPGKISVLMRFGTMADKAALTGALTDGPVRDRIFDIVMRRIDVMQAHRPGVQALLRELPRDPLTALALGAASLRSMAWMLEGVGLTTAGLRGQLRVQGMLALWLATLRAWDRDQSEDLSATMAALDQALDRAAQAEATMAEMPCGRRTSEVAEAGTGNLETASDIAEASSEIAETTPDDEDGL